MSKLTVGALGVLLVVAGGGCATTYRVTEDLPPAQPPVVKPLRRPPVIAVSAKPADKNAGRLTSSLRGAVESRLAARGMTVASPLAANATVRIEVSRRETARLDEWRTYEGEARLRVMTADPTARLLSETTIRAAGDRALDETKAEQGVLNGLVRKANAWLDGTVTAKSIPVAQPIPPPGYSVARIRLHPEGGFDGDDEIRNAQIAFRTAVSAIPGVRDCRLEPSASDARNAVFDITYEAVSFPDGLVNTIVARLRGQGLNVAR